MLMQVLEFVGMQDKLEEQGIIAAYEDAITGDYVILMNNIDLFESWIGNREVKCQELIGKDINYKLDFKQVSYGRVFRYTIILDEHQYLEHKRR